MKNNYVWYACYGSNLFRDRFLCYIKGGKPANSTRVEVGCNDKSLPLADDKITIDLPLYFAMKISHWNNGGGCFLGHKSDEKNKTLGRKYLITKEQFIDVVRQENNNFELDVDFETVIKNGNSVITDSKYGNLFYLGDYEQNPIFTFTSPHKFGVLGVNKPDILYLKTILNGLREIYDFSLEFFVDYFLTKPGAKENYSKEELMNELKF